MGTLSAVQLIKDCQLWKGETSVHLWPFQQELNPTHSHWKHPIFFLSLLWLFLIVFQDGYFELQAFCIFLTPISFTSARPNTQHFHSFGMPASSMTHRDCWGHWVLCALYCILMAHALSHPGLLQCTMPA